MQHSVAREQRPTLSYRWRYSGIHRQLFRIAVTVDHGKFIPIRLTSAAAMIVKCS